MPCKGRIGTILCTYISLKIYICIQWIQNRFLLSTPCKGSKQAEKETIMPIDTTHIDLVALIEQRTNIRFIHKSTSAGGEWKGSCPFCELGKDRFFIQPYAGRPHYHCRVCGRTGDAIAFLEEHENLTFKQALVELELESEGFIEPKFRFYDDPPCKEWQNAASDFIQRAERYLWLENVEMSRKALEYLRGRGFTDETIRGAKLGYVPLARDGRWFSAPLEAWGLSQEQTLKDVVRIADGIVIPWIAFGDVWKICIKRPWVENSKTELVYGQVVGSGEGLYGADSIKPGEPALLVEGEFDKLTVSQESDIACAATGSTSRGRIQRWIQLFNQASLVLQSFDNDAAGDDGAVFWLENIPKAIRWKPWKKDPNEMLQRGQPVGVWVELGIQSAQIVQPTPCPSESEIQASSQPVVPLPALSRTCSEIWCNKTAEWYVEGGRAFCHTCHSRLGYSKWYHEPHSAI